MIDLATEVEGLTLSIAIQQTTRFTSTLSSMIRWKFLLVEVTKTASMQLWTTMLDQCRVQQLTLFTQRTQCRKMFICLSTKTNTTKFLKVVGDLYKAFLVHEKGKTFDSFKLQLALELVHNCRVFFEEIRTHHLPRCAI